MNAVRHRHQQIARFSLINTPVGRIGLAGTDQGVFNVNFTVASQDRYVELLEADGFDVEPDDGSVIQAGEEILAYLAGTVKRFTVKLDLRGVPTFSSAVLRATRQIPFGATCSYGSIAAGIGAPRSSRAVGNALGRNPVPILIPCHRVVAAGGKLGGFTGGLAMKRALLSLEGHAIDGTVVRPTV